ncbi:hypothetical protein F503_01966 [Ophiostoma piceae UAMH 11346]|uniref:Extracellular membrane protein CFEM domain-containing protein n=1 Tax=Ophiostoma piceae (strain UAMH 11346) TaxID=1262450 RepID=S3CAI8_OPHP1|nr:hypothetical protein F503_01966 [Ophiostoma piceae UAMH 11346]
MRTSTTMTRQKTCLLTAFASSLLLLPIASAAFTGCLGVCVANNGCSTTSARCICSASSSTSFLGNVVECVAELCLLGSSNQLCPLGSEQHRLVYLGRRRRSNNDNGGDHDPNNVGINDHTKDANYSSKNDVVFIIGFFYINLIKVNLNIFTTLNILSDFNILTFHTIPNITDLFLGSLIIPTSTTKQKSTSTKAEPAVDTTDSSPFTNTNSAASAIAHSGNAWRVATVAALPMLLSMAVRLI